MSSICLSTSVNRHFLHKLMDLADTTPVVVSQDIVEANGSLLLVKGSQLTREHARTLGGQKLTKTLESALLAPHVLNTDQIVACAARILDTSLPMSRILRATSAHGPSPLTLLSRMDLGPAMRMMLALSDRAGPAALEHSVTVGLLSICMAKKLRLSDDDQLAAGIAGLLHDIGELYIDPVYLTPGKRLLPHEWAHRVIHPRIGQMLVNELASYPLAVGRAVAEHHERFDGTGYPRQVLGNHISAPGQALSVAEMIAGILNKDYPLERAELALKIIPGEHPHDLLSAISGALRSQQRAEAIEQPYVAQGEGVERLFWRILSALETGRNLLGGTAASSPRARDLLERTLERIKTIQRAFISTGLDIYLNQNHGLNNDADGAILFEKVVATREIQWRLRDIARDLALQTAASPDERTVFSGLIHLLDDDSANELTKPRVAALEKLVVLAPPGFASGQAHAP
jgi:hypothetical protein